MPCGPTVQTAKTILMILTLCSSGQQIDWDPQTHCGRPVQITGRARFCVAQEKENALRGQAVRPNVTLSADPDWEETMAKVRREALPASSSNVKFRPLPEDVARRVIAGLASDAMEVGEAQSKIRRAIIGAAVDRWNAEQQRRPGPRSPAEFAQFENDVTAALAAAGVGSF